MAGVSCWEVHSGRSRREEGYVLQPASPKATDELASYAVVLAGRHQKRDHVASRHQTRRDRVALRHLKAVARPKNDNMKASLDAIP